MIKKNLFGKITRCSLEGLYIFLFNIFFVSKKNLNKKTLLKNIIRKKCIMTKYVLKTGTDLFYV